MTSLRRFYNLVLQQPVDPEPAMTAAQLRRLVGGTGCAQCGRVARRTYKQWNWCGRERCLEQLRVIHQSHALAKSLKARKV